MSIEGEMYGWRVKIGFISPGTCWCSAEEYYPVLPEGVAFAVTTLGGAKIAPDEFEKIFDKYLPAALDCESHLCDVIVAGGAATFTHMGYERTQELIQKIRERVKVPVLMTLNAHFNALKALSAKKIVMATPYKEALTEARKKLCERLGFEVLNFKCLGLGHKTELERLPHWASYRVAKEAFMGSPEADAIYIPGPSWPVVRNIEKLEVDTGKPVVSDVVAIIWASLREVKFKAPVKGFGTLLESCL